jgi:hypothetical protein
MLAEASATQPSGAADPMAIVAAWAEPAAGSVASARPDRIEPAAGWSAAPPMEDSKASAFGDTAPRLGRPALVEQVIDPGGTRRYRLVDPTGGLTAGP